MLNQFACKFCKKSHREPGDGAVEGLCVDLVEAVVHAAVKVDALAVVVHALSILAEELAHFVIYRDLHKLAQIHVHSRSATRKASDQDFHQIRVKQERFMDLVRISHLYFCLRITATYLAFMQHLFLLSANLKFKFSEMLLSLKIEREAAASERCIFARGRLQIATPNPFVIAIT